MKTQLMITAMAAGVVLATVSGCEQRRADVGAGETQTTGAAQEKPTVEKVKDEPSRFYGKRVTLSGEVEDPKAESRSFKLEGNDWIFDDEIRVLAKSPVKMGGEPLAEDHEVVVTGTIRRFTIAEIERDLGWDLAPELEVELRDKPVLVAEEIRRVEPAAKWTAQSPQGELTGTTMLVTATNPDALAGMNINVDRTKVQSVTGKGVWIGPTHAEQTFVMPAAGADISGIKAGDFVDVKGTVKKTPPADEAIKQWGVSPTMRGVIQTEPLYIEAREIKQAGPKQKQKGKSASR